MRTPVQPLPEEEEGNAPRSPVPQETAVTTNMIDMRDAALALHALGLSVIPCGPDKQPLIRWGPYQGSRPTEEQVRAWWTEWRDVNIAIITRPVSGLLVPDVDGPEGERSLDGHALPLIWTARSGRDEGGVHYYFRHPGGRVPSKTGVLPHVDVKADGGMVTCTPSLHHTERRYQWIHEPWETALADAPAWLLDLLRSPTIPTASSQSERIREGRRNDEPARHAGRIRYAGMPSDEIEAALLEVNRSRCVPHLLHDEVRAIARSVSRYAPASTTADPVLLNLKVEVEEVEWIWRGRIARKKPTLLVGDPGVSETTVALDIAARLSRGLECQIRVDRHPAVTRSSSPPKTTSRTRLSPGFWR